MNLTINIDFLNKINSVLFYDGEKWDFPFEIFYKWLSEDMNVPDNFDEIAHLIIDKLNEDQIKIENYNFNKLVKDLDIIII